MALEAAFRRALEQKRLAAIDEVGLYCDEALVCRRDVLGVHRQASNLLPHPRLKLGEWPVHFLNAFRKLVASAKPTRSATSSICSAVFSRNLVATERLPVFRNRENETHNQVGGLVFYQNEGGLFRLSGEPPIKQVSSFDNLAFAEDGTI